MSNFLAISQFSPKFLPTLLFLCIALKLHNRPNFGVLLQKKTGAIV